LWLDCAKAWIRIISRMLKRPWTAALTLSNSFVLRLSGYVIIMALWPTQNAYGKANVGICGTMKGVSPNVLFALKLHTSARNLNAPAFRSGIPGTITKAKGKRHITHRNAAGSKDTRISHGLAPMGIALIHCYCNCVGDLGIFLENNVQRIA
jgi:hypothetical protein